MTMTLGFGSFGYFEALFDESVAHAIFVALAKHAPKEPLRVLRRAGNRYSVTEIDFDGVESPCADAAQIVAAVADASFVDWPSSDAPMGVAPILLPGAGWDLEGLSAEPVIASEDVAFHFDVCETDEARRRLDERCGALLDVAEQHMLVMVFR